MMKPAPAAAPADLAPVLPHYIRVRMADATYLIPRDAVKWAIWHKIPPALKDPESVEARQPRMVTLRIGIKSALRMVLPSALKEMFGPNAPQPPPRADLLHWLCNLFVNVVIDHMSLREWSIQIEPCTSCEDRLFEVVGVAADADPAPGAADETDETDASSDPGSSDRSKDSNQP